MLGHQTADRSSLKRNRELAPDREGSPSRQQELQQQSRQQNSRYSNPVKTANLRRDNFIQGRYMTW